MERIGFLKENTYWQTGLLIGGLIRGNLAI